MVPHPSPPSPVACVVALPEAIFIGGRPAAVLAALRRLSAAAEDALPPGSVPTLRTLLTPGAPRPRSG